MKRSDIATETFNNNLNCAQTVIGAYAEQYKLDKNTLYKLIFAFGGGMGHTNGICGAISGGLMVLGLKHNSEQFDKDTTYAQTRHLMDEFIKRNGTRDCEKLIGVDFLTEEGKKEFKSKDIKKNICEKCIADLIDIVENS
jgi:C_GCAxxG_C_C family probable redox protein